MNMKHYSTLSLCILMATQAHSAGFQVAEHSASGLGRAFSGEAAVADNAAVLARNPSAMTLFDRAQFSGALTVIDPEVDVWDRTNGESAKDVAPVQFVPAAYYISPVNEKWAWGIGMFTTYGVATDYPDNIQAGDLAGDTSLISVNLNPTELVEGVVGDVEPGVHRLEMLIGVGGGAPHHRGEELRLVVDLGRHVGVGEVGRQLVRIEDAVIEVRDDPTDRGEPAVSIEDGIAHPSLPD